MLKYLSYILGLILIVLATGFSILNTQHVNLNYYVGSVSLSLAMLLLLTLFLGLILGALLFLPKLIRTKNNNRKLRQIVRQYEEEIQNLRTFPLKDAP